MISRRRFLQLAALSAVPRGGRPRGCEFVFARLRYESGDWDYNPKVAANVLDSIVQERRFPCTGTKSSSRPPPTTSSRSRSSS